MLFVIKCVLLKYSWLYMPIETYVVVDRDIILFYILKKVSAFKICSINIQLLQWRVYRVGRLVPGLPNFYLTVWLFLSKIKMLPNNISNIFYYWILLSYLYPMWKDKSSLIVMNTLTYYTVLQNKTGLPNYFVLNTPLNYYDL